MAPVAIGALDPGLAAARSVRHRHDHRRDNGPVERVLRIRTGEQGIDAL